MTRRPTLSRWLLPAALLLAVLGLPASGSVGSSTLNYYANFNDAAAQGPGNKTWKAYGGAVSVDGPQDVFQVVFPTPQDGEMEIQPNPFGSDSELSFELDMPVIAPLCDVGFALTATSGVFSDFDVRFDDVGDIGVLDMQFTEEGTVRVDGQEILLPLLGGEVELYVNVTLETTAVGSQMWSMTLTGPSVSATASGSLNVPTLTLNSLHFIRRAGEVGAVWTLDDVLVTSSDPNSPNFVPDGAFRPK